MASPLKQDDQQEIYKIVLAGDSGVGKTHILNRYIKGQIPKNNIVPTIGVEFATKIVTLKSSEKVKAQIWDTAGQERYRSITTAHYRKARGALLVFDVTKEKTFDNVTRWIEDIKYMAEPDLIIMLVGNKIDLVNKDASARKVSKEECKRLAIENNLLFLETSAFEGTNIISVFEDLLNEISQKKKQYEDSNINNRKNVALGENNTNTSAVNATGVCKGC